MNVALETVSADMCNEKKLSSVQRVENFKMVTIVKPLPFIGAVKLLF